MRSLLKYPTAYYYCGSAVEDDSDSGDSCFLLRSCDCFADFRHRRRHLVDCSFAVGYDFLCSFQHDESLLERHLLPNQSPHQEYEGI